MTPKRMPAWADGSEDIDRQREEEEAREDQWLKEVESGLTPPAVRLDYEWSDTGEVAARHRLTPKTIRAYIHDGRLKARATNPDAPPRQRRYLIHRDDELAWVEAKAAVRRAAGGPRKTGGGSTGRSFKSRVQK